MIIIIISDFIADATGKLVKLNSRSSKIYVEYMSDWPRANNYIKKLNKMQVSNKIFHLCHISYVLF